MKALSIRQPWAHLILHHGKDVENRSWPTKYRGPLLIHAGVAKPQFPFELAEFLRDSGLSIQEVADLAHAPRGGIVGVATLVDCVRDAPSDWAVHGEWHWLLHDARELPFQPLKGRLGLFDVELEPGERAA